MRKAVLFLLTVCLVLCFIDALALDYSQYEIRHRFTMNVILLRDDEFVAETWEDQYGDVRNDWHVTWWKDDAGNINPVLVPYDVLDKTDNPGITLQ